MKEDETEDEMSHFSDDEEESLWIESNKELDSPQSDASEGESLLRLGLFEELGSSSLVLVVPSKVLFIEGYLLCRASIPLII